MNKLRIYFNSILKPDFPMILVIVLSILGLTIISSIKSEILGQPERFYYYKTNNGSLIPASVSYNPRYNDEKVIRFVRRVISKCFSINTESAQLILDGDSDNDYMSCINANFSPIAATTLFNVYPQDELVETILEFDATANAISALAPTVIDRNKPEDPLKWIVSIPVMVTIQSLSSDQTTSFFALFTVIPNREANNPSNLSVSKVEFL